MIKHPEILDRSETYLKIFTSPVKIDKNLPKFTNSLLKMEKTETPDLGESRIILSGGSAVLQTGTSVFQELSEEDPDSIALGEDLSGESEFSMNLDLNSSEITRRELFGIGSWNAIDSEASESGPVKEESKSLFGWLKSIIPGFKEPKPSPPDIPELGILEFFKVFKSEIMTEQQVVNYQEKVKVYLDQMKAAAEMGQKALFDKLKDGVRAAKTCALLEASGTKYYRVPEEKVVEFVKKTERGLRLDYVKNFARPIPADVLEKKKKADSLNAFDNYCILHYDPDNKAIAKTKEEKEAERQKKSDPILFGMIYGSRELFYVADWIDEYCDLTIDKFIETVGGI